ncbi:hypothetical protein C5O00_04745 [Pukyongia salina]|uniref:Secretion system C-terminal sorting domain-containing protein n=1 Tax=Pukyongia salina TaxID=2094025 RepID=A0A2S0HV02_9FLAO|nr:T9SS type A sorting domain-containing protein [Pukyongia salina]AVI50511.1 hypothetical protein C5O00_04745 [Pukyongia salina]
MINLYLLIIASLIFTTGIAQCFTNPTVQTDYQADAMAFVLRDIQSDPTDPDFDNPLISASRIVPYIEKLSAIYENPNGEAIVDSIFNEFQIHANYEIGQSLNYSTIYLQVDHAAPWLNAFLTTGVSGNNTLDNLMIGYEFSITSDAPLTNYHWVVIDTNIPALNTPALVDDFLMVSDILGVEASPAGVAERLNYTGIPYVLNGWDVAATDITFDGSLVCFSLYSGDCFAGCLYSKSFCVNVSEDCEVEFFLGNEEHIFDNVLIYPNPARDIINTQVMPNVFHTYSIYNIGGQIIHDSEEISTTINVSSLPSGIYFIEFQTTEGQKHIQKFIKQ